MSLATYDWSVWGLVIGVPALIALNAWPSVSSMFKSIFRMTEPSKRTRAMEAAGRAYELAEFFREVGDETGFTAAQTCAARAVVTPFGEDA